MGKLNDKIAIITGGASGIGLAVGEQLAKRGATVILADINGAQAEAAALKINSAGGKSEAACVNVSDAVAVQQLVDGVAARYGRLDYMFNNAGISMTGEARDTNLADWDRIIKVNLNGVVNGIQAAYPLMIRQGHGHIINTGSIAGLVPFPLNMVYSATKHAVVALSASLRTEAAGLGVKVSVVCPGFIDTPLKDTLTYRNMDKEEAKKALPFKLHPVEGCATAIVNGVLRNKAFIVTPLHAKLLWWIYRSLPGFFLWANTIAAGKSRKLRKEDGKSQLLLPSGERYTFDAICAQNKGTLEQIFMRGTALDLRQTSGWQYKGSNVSFVSLILRIRKFIKVFRPETTAAPDVIDGYNFWARQNGRLDRPWEPSSPNRHGFYKVYRVQPNEQDNKFPHAMLINYGLGNNPWYNPSRFLRDYIVQVYPDNPCLLIGGAFFALGSMRIFGGYFVMERLRKADKDHEEEAHGKSCIQGNS